MFLSRSHMGVLKRMCMVQVAAQGNKQERGSGSDRR